MINPCECCQRNLKFIRQINGNYMHSMVIPEWFVNCFGGKISGTIKLEAPDGNIYDVGVTENMNRTILKAGWAAFVDANQIQVNYCLMFQHNGNARFKVTIFDSNGKEKSSCCARTKTASGVKKPNTYDVDNSSRSYGCTNRSSAGEGSDSDRSQKESSCHYKSPSKTPPISYSSGECSEDSPSVDDSMESDDRQMLSDYIVLSGHCYLTEEQEVNIQELVRKMQTEIPVLVVVMKKTNVKLYGNVVIRKDYSQVYFPRASQTIRVKVPRKSKDWQCSLYIRPDGGCNLYFGNFARDNSVQEGDVCIFQPMSKVNKRVFTVMVHVLHKVSIGHSPGRRSGSVSNQRRISTKIVSTSRVKEEPAADGMASRLKEDIANGEEISSSAYEDHGSFEEFSEEDNLSLEDSVESYSRQMLSDDYVLSGRCHFTKAQETEIRALVKKIRPEIPVLVVVMTMSSVVQHGSLGIHKVYALKYFPSEDTNIILQLPRKSKNWKCKFHIKPPGVSGAGRRSLSCGNFFCDNDVKEGDICLFQPMTNVKRGRFTITVHLLRKVSIDHLPGGRTDIGSNNGRTSTKMAGAKEEPPSDGVETSSENEDHGVSDDDSEGPCEPPFMLAGRPGLTPAQEKRVLEKVEEIESDLPCYVAIINKNNVYKHGSLRTPILNFGSQYAVRYLGEELAAGCRRGKSSVICLVLQREGKLGSWPTELCHKRHNGGLEFRVRKGWTSFARDNRLREKDLCLFKLEKNEEPLKMMVYIIRRA